MKVDHIVSQFDESYNVLKKCQIDLHVRYCDFTTNTVTTWYYNLQFLGKAASKDVLEKFKQCMSGIDQDKFLQDGPNVNTSFLSMLSKEWREEELSDLVSIGSCGLHTVNNSFKQGKNSTEWKLKKLLTSVYTIFHECPSQRSDYQTLTAATDSDYPLNFCGHCWVWNKNFVKTAREVWFKIVDSLGALMDLPNWFLQKVLSAWVCKSDIMH